MLLLPQHLSQRQSSLPKLRHLLSLLLKHLSPSTCCLYQGRGSSCHYNWNSQNLDLSDASTAVIALLQPVAVPTSYWLCTISSPPSGWLAQLISVICASAYLTFYQSTMRAIHIRDIRYILSVIHNYMLSTYDACSICFRFLMYLAHTINWYDACSLYFAFKDCWMSCACYRSLVFLYMLSMISIYYELRWSINVLVLSHMF